MYAYYCSVTVISGTGRTQKYIVWYLLVAGKFKFDIGMLLLVQIMGCTGIQFAQVKNLKVELRLRNSNALRRHQDMD